MFNSMPMRSSPVLVPAPTCDVAVHDSSGLLRGHRMGTPWERKDQERAGKTRYGEVATPVMAWCFAVHPGLIDQDQDGHVLTRNA